MTADYIPSASSFAKLLEWLGPDRDQSAARYEEIRRKIIRFFICRGCVESEDLTDVTIDRVTRVVDRSSFQYVGNPILYFYGVAKKVHLEHLRQQVRLRQRQVTFDGPGQDGTSSGMLGALPAHTGRK